MSICGVIRLDIKRIKFTQVRLRNLGNCQPQLLHPETVDGVSDMSKNENTTSVESMTERYSFGHKAISVALSVVLLGFGWPAVSPSAANAEGDQATTATATQAAGDAAASASESGAAATSATAATDAAAGGASSATDTGTAAATAALGTQGTGAVATDAAASDADVRLTLGNASITYKGQVIAQPAQKVTVSATDDFEFSVTPDNGYALTQVKLKVAGANESILTPDDQGVYTVTAANVAAGAAVTLATEEQQAATEPVQDATPIEQTATDDAAAVAADAQAATDTQADAGSISGPNVVLQKETITLTYDGDMTPQNWVGGDGLFFVWSISTDKKSLTLTATSNWAFNGSEKKTTIYLEYSDQNGVWHTGLNGMPFEVTVKKRSFTIVQPDPVAEGESHFWIPKIKDNESGDIIDLSTAPDGSFYPFEYYRDGQKIENNSQYWHDDNEFKKSGTYTVVIKPNSGWIYDFGGASQIEVTIPTKKPDSTATEKWIYVGESVGLTSNQSSDYCNYKWEVSSGSQFVELSGNDDDKRTAKGAAVGTATVIRYERLSWSWNSQWTPVDTFTVHVLPKPAVTSLEIYGDHTVEQFKDITLTTNAGSDVTWTSSDPSVATIDANGKVVGVKKGKVTITATTVTSDGKVLTATHDVTVTDSSATANDAYLFFQNSPTANPDSNETAAWFPSGGAHDLGIRLNLDGISWSGTNSYDNVTNRVVSWPDGSTGSAWVIKRDDATYGKYWTSVFENWKSTLSKEQGTQITEDDVEEISLIPYKISSNSCGYHLDCKVVVKCSKAINAIFYLQDAGSNGFAQYDSATYPLNSGKATVAAPSNTPDDTKSVGGVTYKFMGWYSDQACTQRVTFPVVVSDNANYYGKYVPMDQSIQVNYYLDGTTTPVAPSQTLTGLMKGQAVTQTPKDIAGYTPVSSAAQTATVGTDSEINFYYTANPVDYKVEYYWNGSDTPFKTETVSGHNVGEWINDIAPGQVDGYTPVNSDTEDIQLTADESKNVVKFYYYKNVTLKANSATVPYSGQEQRVEGYETLLNNVELVDASFNNIVLTGGKGVDADHYPYGFADGTIGAVDVSRKYFVTAVQPGELIINPVQTLVIVKIAGNSDTQKYSGQEQKVAGYTVKGIKGSDLYSQDYVKFNGKAEAVGTDASSIPYQMGLKASDFENTSTNFTNVQFQVTDGGLVINPRDITLKSGSYDKPYDGKDHSVETVEVSGEGFVSGEGATYSNFPKVNDVTKEDVQNTFAVTPNDGTKLGNYKIMYDCGTLKVTQTDINTEGVVNLITQDASYTYDGEAHNPYQATAYDNNVAANAFKIEYQTPDGNWTDDVSKIQATNVSETRDVQIRVSDPRGNYSGYMYVDKAEKLTITPRPVTLTSDNKSKTYNGEPLTAENVTATSTAGSFAFVSGEEPTYSNFKSQTDATGAEGVDNTFDYKLPYGVDRHNYNIETVNGKLIVMPDSTEVVVTIKGNSGTGKETYNGAEQTVSGYEVTSISNNKYTSGDFTFSGDATIAGTDAGTYYGNLNESDFTNNNSNFSNVTFKVTNGSLTIAKREVTLTSGNYKNAFDGKEHQVKDVTVGGDGFVEGEGASYDGFARIRNVGTVNNTFTYHLNENTSSGNYRITQVPGTLEVTQAGINTDGAVVVTPQNVSGKYTGDAYAAGVATARDTLTATNDLKIEYSVDGENWTENASDITATNVVDSKTVKIRVSDRQGNYAGYKEDSETITVTPRTVVLTSNSGEKVYDGTALTNTSDPVVSEDGFTKNEGATFSNFASRTEVTTGEGVDNTFAYELKDGTLASNYTIAKEYGKLKVTPADMKTAVTLTGSPATRVYNGKELHANAATATDANNNAYQFKIQYRVKGESEWLDSADAISRVDAGTTTVEVRATDPAGNYANEATAEEIITVDKRPLTITGEGYDAEQPYTGTEYKKTGYSWQESDASDQSGLVDGESVQAEYLLVGTQVNTNPGYTGVFGNVSVSNGTKDVTENYDIAQVPGTLIITASAIAQYVTLTTQDVEYVYNGQPHTAATATAVDKNGNEPKVEYSRDGVNWTDDVNQITATNVSESVTVKVRVSVEGVYAGYLEGEEKLTIKPRPVTFTGKTNTVQYNGSKQSVTDITAEEAADNSDTGILSGQSYSGISYKAAGTNAREEAYPGAFGGTATFADKDGNDVTGNYAPSYQPGSLTITKSDAAVVVTIKGHTDRKLYDGTEHTVSGYDVTGITLNDHETDLLASNDIKLKDGAKAEVAGTDATTYFMQLDSDSFENTNTNFSNVTFEVTKGSLQIDARKVILTSGSYDGPYDGQSHQNTDITVSGDGFLPTDNPLYVEPQYTGFPSVTNAGDKKQNTFTCSYEGKSSNYIIEKNYGALRVQQATDLALVDLNANNYTGVYDGQAHGNPVTTNAKGGKTIISYSTDGGNTWSEEYPQVTNVSDSTNVIVRAENTNYYWAAVGEYKLTVTKRPATANHENTLPYTGSKQTMDIAQGSISNVVEGENLTLSGATISGTEAGSYTNVKAGYTWSVAKADGSDSTGNYTLGVSGKLTIAQDNQLAFVDLDKAGYNGVYDGGAHAGGAVQTNAKSGETTIEYSVDNGATWQSQAPAITNKGERIVLVRASNPNYSNVAEGSYKLEVTPKRVVVSTSGSKTYNGAQQELAISADNVDATQNVVAGETLALSGAKVSGKDAADTPYTKVSDYTWSVAKADGTDSTGNYTIEVSGALTITPVQNVMVQVKGNSNEVTYNGTEQKAEGYTVVENGISDSLYTKADFKLTDNTQAVAAGTHVADSPVFMGLTSDSFENVNPNFENVTFEVVEDGSLTINPATLTVKTDGNTQMYNGKALTASGTYEGLQNNETIGFATTGSQTDFGTSGNTYTIEWHKDGGLFGIGGNNYTARESDYTVSEDLGKLSVSKRLVVLASGSDKRAYNGEALTKPGVTVVGNGFVDGEVASVEATGSVTDVDKVPNSIAVETTQKFKEDNYIIAKHEGELEVTPAAIKDYVTLITQSVTKPYDGAALNALPATAECAIDGNVLTIEYQKADGTWTANPADISATNVDDSMSAEKSNAVNVRVTSSKNFKGEVTGTQDVVVTPKAVALESFGKTKVYDGAPLTNDVVSGGDGFVAGEVESVKATGAITNVGEEDNTIEVKKTDKYIESNYSVSETLGKLKVTEQSIAPGTEEKPNDSYKGVEVDSPLNVSYDGEAHKWAPTVTGKDADGNAAALVEGADYEVSYARDGKATDDFTNAGTITVAITGKGNYSGTVTRTYQITPREVAITTGSNTKVYDGTELTSDKGSIEGLVASEKDGVKVVPNGKQVEIGSSKNTYTINWGSVNSNNYKVVSEDLGTLTVTAQSIDPGTEEKPNPSYKGASVNAPSDSVYNGEAHQWIPSVTGKDADGNAAALAEGIDYEVSYARDGKATDDFTNAGTITVTITGKGNYTGTVTRTYQITPAQLTITTPGDEKTYDGTPLTKSATAAECVSGLVKGETVGFKTTGSRTEVGSSDNTYEIEWTGTAKESNYLIKSVSLGKLVVKESANQIVVTTTGGQFTYDGQAHGAAVSVSELPTGYTLEAAASTATATDVTQSDVAATADQLVIRNAAGEDVTSKLNIKKVDGTIKVTPATLTVVMPDASKVYDGNALTAAGTVTGFVNGETATFETTGSQTNEGSSSNTYKITWNGTAKQGNYAVSETLGTLTVSAQSIDPGTSDKPNPSFKGVRVGQLDNTVYNGKEQRFEPKVTDANGAVMVKGRDYTLAWSADATNAGTVTVTVTGAGNYAGSVTRTYAIAKRSVTLKSESATKAYDGVALERPDVAVTSYYDFVDGEVEGVKATGSVLNAGSEQNAIEITGVKGKYNPKNYDVTFDEGTLTVTKADAESAITLQTKSDGKLYDGNAIVLPEAAASVKQGQGVNAVTIEYQKADGAWTQNASDITATDVADSREVAVRASSPTNYDGYAYGTATLSVGVRNVTLKSNSASKVFDGEALTAPEVIVDGDGFVTDEVTDIAATGALTKVGSTPNAISYKTGENFKSGNYNIQEQPGTLIVSAQSIDPGTSDKPNPSFAGVEVSAPSNSVYDGQAHQWTPTVTDKNGNELAAGTDYEVAYSTEDFTNVTGVITVTITGKGNYAGAVTRAYEITPAPVKVETFSDSKTYDGTELTAGGQVTGVVAGETYDFAATGSQTAVGSSDNTYSLSWSGTAKEANYQIVEKKIGKLTVNEAADEVTVTTIGGTFTYDGQDHGATVAVTGLPTGYYVENAYSNASARNVADGTVAATADVLVIKNAQGEDVTGKLNINRVDGSITITAAPLAITTGSASKQYDGIAATSDTATAEGAKGSDHVTVWATGEQTEVGSSSNTYGIYWGAVDQRNYTVTENLGTLQVDPNTAAVTIEGASASKTYDGTALATNEVASFTGLPAGFTVELAAAGNRTDVGNSENTVSGYTIKSMYGDDATKFFTNVTVVPGTLTVDPAELTVTTQGAEKVFDGTPLKNDNGEVAGLVNGETATVVPNGSQTEVGTSSNGYSMQWGTAKSGNYKIVSETLGTLKVTAQSITPGTNPDEPDPAYKGIQVSNPADMVYDGQAHQWAPEATDGNKVLAEGTDYAVSYSTNDFTNVTGIITVTIAGKGNYAGTVERSYQIVPRSVELASDTDSKPYDGTALTRPDVTVTSTYDFVAGEVSDLVATGSALNAGDAVTNTITYAKGTAYRDANYNVTKREGTLSVYAKQITASDMTVGAVDDVTYNGKEQKQKPEVKDGAGTLVEGVDYDLVYSDDVTNAGNVTVTVVGKGNYAGSVNRSYAIKKAPLTVATSSASKAYDGTELTAAGTINGFVNGETAAFAVTGTQTTVGSSKNWYTIDWNGTAKAANYSIAETIGTLTVTESENEVVVTTTGGEFTYDGQAHGATVEVTGLPTGYAAQASSEATATDVNGEGVTATANNLVIRNTNGEDVTASLNVKRIDGAIKVVPAELTVVTPDASKTYDGSALTAAGTIAGFVNGEAATLNTTGSQTEVGSSENAYAIAWDGTAKQGNYAVNATVGTLTVNAQSITPGLNPDEPDPAYRGIRVSSPVDVEYDGLAHQWVPEVTDAGKALTAGTDYDVAYITTDFTNVTGVITVTITGKGNYTGSVTRTYQITPAPLSVETYSDFKVYDGNALTAGGKLDGLKNGETATFATTGSQTEVGSSQNGYTLTFDQTAKGSNYRIASENLGTLRVAESGEQIVVTTTGGTFTYDGQAHGATVAVSQLPEGYTLETAASSATAKNVADGVVAATADQLVIRNAQGQDVTDRLNIVKVDGQIEVTPAELTVATAGGTKQFDNTPLTNSSMSITGLVPGDSVTAKTTGSQTAVGTSKNTYEITWSNADASNYNVVEQLGDLTVTAQTVVPATPVQPGGTTPGGATPTPATPSTTPSGAATPTGVPANPGNPVDAIAQVLESAVDAVAGTSDQPAEEQIFDDENPLGTTVHANCWVHWFMIIGMILTVLYGAGVAGRRTRFAHSLNANMKDVLNAFEEKN